MDSSSAYCKWAISVIEFPHTHTHNLRRRKYFDCGLTVEIPSLAHLHKSRRSKRDEMLLSFCCKTETARWIMSPPNDSNSNLHFCVFCQAQVMSRSVGSGSRMTFARLLLPFLIIHSFCEGESSFVALGFFFSSSFFYARQLWYKKKGL